MEYLHKCAEDFQEATKHDTRRQIFVKLFQMCHYIKVSKAALSVISMWACSQFGISLGHCLLFLFLNSRSSLCAYSAVF